MKTHLIFFTAVGISLSSVTTSAQTPTVRFQQSSTQLAYGSRDSAASHIGQSNVEQSWEEFTFETDEEIAEVRWEGLYIHVFTDPIRGAFVPNSSNWRISVWTDKDGQPDTRVFLETHPASSVEIISENTVEYGPFPPVYDFDGLMSTQLYEFSLKLTDRFPAAAGAKYWISIQSLSNAFDPIFFWTWGSETASPVAQRSFAAIAPEDAGFFQKGFDDDPGSLAFTLLTVPGNDLDQDGMDDDWEEANGLGRLNLDDSAFDDDDDGSINLKEFENGTDPLNPDTDGDGLLDGVETGTEIYVDETDTGTSPILADSDRDGLLDSQENPSLPYEPGLQSGTDPNFRDSDGDDYEDRLEFSQDLAPNDPFIHPNLIALGNGNEALIGNDLTDPSNNPVITTFAGTDGERLFDNTLVGPAHEWATELQLGGSDGPLMVELELQDRFQLTHFTIASGSGDPDHDPFMWELQGSPDGQHWETIFHRQNREKQLWTARSQVLRFDSGVHFASPAAYSSFRLVFQASGINAQLALRLGEVELFGTEAVVTVVNNNSSGPGSLRQAISDCPTNGTIVFDPSLAGSTIKLEGESLVFERNLTIDASSLPEPVTIFGEGSGSVISVSEECLVHLHSLIISGSGRGVENAGSLTMTRVKITENDSGGIRNEGTLLLSSSLVASNRDVFSAGIYNDGILTAEYTTIANNRKLPGNFDGVPRAENRNSGTFILNHSTLVAPSGRGIFQLSNLGTLRITNSTVYGSILNRRLPGRRGVMTITNSIFALPISSSSELVATGNNLISHLNGSGLTEGPGIIVAEPLLAPLGDYGGPTPTMPPLPGSPAIDVFDDPQEAATDQRGFPRLVGDDYDLGAVEYQGDADFARVFHVDYDQDGNSLGIESALSTDPFTPDQNHPNNLGAPVFNGAAQPVLTFGLGEDAHPDTTWILERSTDLLNFEEIYAFDGTTDFATEGLPIEVNRTAERITITDQAPPTKGAYYRFRAGLK